MKPSRAVDRPTMNRGRPIAIAQNATDGDDDDVAEEVFAIARMTRVGERLKERTDRFDIDELRHENILEFEPNRHAITFAFDDCSRSKDMAHRPGAQDPYLAQLCARTLLADGYPLSLVEQFVQVDFELMVR